MALIKCPECGKEVSDKVENCIHCGYPLDLKDNTKMIYLHDYDMIKIEKYLRENNYKEIFIEIATKFQDISLGNQAVLFNQIKDNNIIPKSFEVVTYSDDTDKMLFKSVADEFGFSIEFSNSPKQKDNSVKCPRCGSTQIQAVPRKWSLMTGLLTNKVDRVCLNCKNKF